MPSCFFPIYMTLYNQSTTNIFFITSTLRIELIFFWRNYIILAICIDWSESCTQKSVNDFPFFAVLRFLKFSLPDKRGCGEQSRTPACCLVSFCGILTLPMEPMGPVIFMKIARICQNPQHQAIKKSSRYE